MSSAAFNLFYRDVTVFHGGDESPRQLSPPLPQADKLPRPSLQYHEPVDADPQHLHLAQFLPYKAKKLGKSKIRIDET
jgi:hypothetical protein